MALSASKAAGVAIALLLAGSALAMGLGEASGRAILGQPLRLEIPILGGDGSLLTSRCFHLQAPRAEIGNDFVVRSARIDIVGGPRGAKLIVATAAAVTDPVVGFAVSAGCDVGLSRDYVLLVALPDAAPLAPASEAPRTAAAAEPVQPAGPAPEKEARSRDDMLRVDGSLTLDALARQKYPLQPKAREKFMRMMMQANPALTSGEARIEAGTELHLPPGLPQRRVGPYRSESTAAQRASAAATATAVTPTTHKTPPRGDKTSKDRLVLGTVAESNESKLLAEAERLTNMLIEQNKAQDELVANVARLEADNAGLRKEFVAMQTGLARVEAERKAEKRAAEDLKSAQIVELLVAVLAGGAAGGAGLHVFQRRRLRSQADARDDDAQEDDGPVAVPPVAATPVTVSRVIASAPAEAIAAPEPPSAPAAVLAEILQETPAAAAEPSSPGLPPEIPIDVPERQSALEPLNFSPVSLSEQEKSLAPPAMPAEGTPAPQEAAPQEVLALDFPEISIAAAEHVDSLDFHER